MNNVKEYHAHPLMILSNLRQFFILAVIPIARGLVNALRGDFSSWSQGLWIDLLLLFFILLFAVLRWWRCTYFYDDHSIYQKQGLFFSKQTHLPWESITVLKVTQPFYLRPVGACLFRCDSLGGSYRDADIRLILSRKKAQELSTFFAKKQNQKTEQVISKPKFSSILAFALLSTNSFVGVFYIAGFISQSGKLLGKEFSEMLAGAFEDFTKMLSLRIPPAAAALAYILLFAWLLGVLFTLFQYANFFVVRREHSLELTGGFVGWQEHIIQVPKLNYISIKQNIITFFMKTASLFVSAIGTGKERSDLTCLIPMIKTEELETSMDLLFPEYHTSPLTLRPVPFGFVRFLTTPIATCLGILAAWYLLASFQPGWATFISFVGITALIPALAFLIMRIVEYRFSGLGINENSYTICYSTGFTLHTQIVPKDKISCILIRQGGIQKFGDHCDLLLFTQSESKAVHKCRNISKSQAVKFFSYSDSLVLYM